MSLCFLRTCLLAAVSLASPRAASAMPVWIFISNSTAGTDSSSVDRNLFNKLSGSVNEVPTLLRNVGGVSPGSKGISGGRTPVSSAS